MIHPDCKKKQPICNKNNYNRIVNIMNFGKWLYDKRKAARLTQGELAARAHISTSYVSTLERQQNHTVTGAQPQPAREVVEKLAKVLGENIDDALNLAGYLPTRLDIETTELDADVRLQLLGAKNFSEDEKREFMEAFQIAYAIAKKRIADRKKQIEDS